VGDTFSNISNSTIVNRSLVSGSFQQLREQGKSDAAAAIRRLGEIIEQSDDQDAVEAFNALNEEVASGSPKKGVVRSLLSGITNALPAVAKVAESVDTIAKAFS
jgi:hypothetical protein